MTGTCAASLGMVTMILAVDPPEQGPRRRSALFARTVAPASKSIGGQTLASVGTDSPHSAVSASWTTTSDAA
jgi:hypothetical protein